MHHNGRLMQGIRKFGASKKSAAETYLNYLY